MVKKIPLTQGQVALVDDEDFDFLNQWKWQAFFDKKLNGFYAVRGAKREDIGFKFRRRIFMHRIIAKTPNGKMTDHINHNSLDNRKNNLRIVTNRQNQQNRRGKYSSRYPGVCWNKRDKKWRARLKINGKYKFLGNFNSEDEAFEMYKNAVHDLTGEKIVWELEHS